MRCGVEDCRWRAQYYITQDNGIRPICLAHSNEALHFGYKVKPIKRSVKKVTARIGPKR